MLDTKFKVGDKVRAFGCEGYIAGIREDALNFYPIKVNFNSGHYTFFTLDGRFEKFHKEPSLFLIERPKQKVKKVMYHAIQRHDADKDVWLSTKFI